MLIFLSLFLSAILVTGIMFFFFLSLSLYRRPLYLSLYLSQWTTLRGR